MSSARRAFKTPSTALSIIIPLSAAIALATAVFAVIDAVWLNALPFRDPGGLVVVGRISTTSPSERPGPTAFPELLDWRERSAAFEALAGYSFAYGSMSAELPEGIRSVDIAAVTPNLFSLLGVPADRGRTFDERGGSPDTIILGHRFWQSAFGGDPQIVGRRIRLRWFGNARDYDVIGVMPDAFQIKYPTSHDAYIPVSGDMLGDAPSRATRTHVVFGRLRPGESVESARVSMRALGDVIRAEFPTTPRTTRVDVMDLHEFLFGRTRPVLVALGAAAILVLVLASANSSSILIAVSLDRSDELAMRAVLGAARWRLAWMLLSEQLMLGVTASLAGLAAASGGVVLLRSIAPPDLARVDALNVNATVMIAAATMSIVATLGSSLVPIWLLDRLNPGEQLRRSYVDRRNDARLLQRVLVAAQIALVMVLLLGASVLVVSLRSLLKVELGFQPEGLVAIRTRFLAENYGPAGLAAQDRVLGALRSRSEVLSAGWTSELPLGPSNVVRLKLREAGDVAVRYRIVSDAYLQAIGASLDRGRLFVPNDRRGAPVAVVNRSFADRYFNGREAVGQEVFIREWHQVVGVIKDVREGALEEVATPTIYWLFAERNWMAGAPWLVVRGPDERTLTPETVRTLVGLAEPDMPTGVSERLNDRLFEHTTRTRFLAAVLSGTAAVALAIAAAGIFGMVSYSVRRRTRELGIRMAIGAGTGSVAWLVLRDVILTTAAGIVAGLVLSWASARFLRAFLFGVEHGDPGIAVLVITIVGVIVACSALMPLRLALAIQPTEALRVR